MKNLCASFIFASAFAYFAGALLAVLGYPPILNLHPVFQYTAFFLMSTLTIATVQLGKNKKPLLPALNLLLAIMWGIMSAFTFTGFIRWTPDGSAPYQLFMTVWDLLLVVAVLEE